MLNPRLEGFKVVVIEEVPTRESVPKSNGSRKKLFEWNFLLING